MPLLTVRYRLLSPSNADLPGGSSIDAMPNQVSPNWAPPLAQPDPAHPGQFLNYGFLFWNIHGTTAGVTTSNPVQIPIGNSDIVATAWYQQQGGGDGPHGVLTFAFSETEDLVWPDSPIASVNPTSAWGGGNNTFVVTGAGPVDITPTHDFVGHPGQTFDMWTVLGPGTVAGIVLHLNVNNSAWAIANYKVPAGSYPDPDWWRLVTTLSNARRMIRKIDLVADPSPEDLVRLKDKLTLASSQQPGPAVELSDIVKQIDQMNVAQIRGSLAEIQANITRLQAARRIADEALKQRQKG